MAAGGVDVRAEVLAESVVDPSTALRTVGFILGENGSEFLDGGIGWFLEGGWGVAIVVADEVDVEEAEAVRSGTDEVGEGLGVSGAVIDALEEDVGEEDFAVGDGEMLVDGDHDLLDGVGGGDGHKLGSLVIEGIVEGEGQVNIGIVAGESFNARNDTDGGDG